LEELNVDRIEIASACKAKRVSRVRDNGLGEQRDENRIEVLTFVDGGLSRMDENGKVQNLLTKDQ
jgi:hypothetical protein